MKGQKRSVNQIATESQEHITTANSKKSRVSKTYVDVYSLSYSSPILSYTPQLYLRAYEKSLKLDFNYFQTYSSLNTSTHLSQIFQSVLFNHPKILGFESSKKLSQCRNLIVLNFMGLSQNVLEEYVLQKNAKDSNNLFLNNCSSIPLDYVYSNNGKAIKNRIITATEALLTKKITLNRPERLNKIDILQMFQQHTVLFTVTYNNSHTDDLCFLYDETMQCKFDDDNLLNETNTVTNTNINIAYGEFYRVNGSSKG